MGGSWLKSRIAGALYGGAIGDALGGAVEGWPLDLVHKVHGGPVQDLLPYIRINKDAVDVGDNNEIRAPAGRTTDDTHFKNLLCQAILKKGGRVNAEEFAAELKPEDSHAYIIMRQALLRLESFRHVYSAERMGQPHISVTDNAAHHGGKGLPPANGAVMMMSPVGLMYPGKPDEAYLAGYEIACAIQQGYSADMAGVVAAGVAAALVPETDLETVVEAMKQVAPGSAAALLDATIALASEAKDFEAFRTAYYDKFLISFLDPGEAVAVAVGSLLLGKGKFEESTLNAVHFGRDCDSIATVAGAIAGAYSGVEEIPPAWIETVDAVREEEPSQGDLADGLYAALQTELNAARQWADQYEELL